MEETEILAPVFALAAWTVCILLLVAFQRVRAALKGQHVVDVYKLGESPELSERVVLPNRNYMNLLELPILFYVICLIAYASQNGTNLAIKLAWLYVSLRVLHSLIHVTYNKVMHRFTIFVASNLVLLSLWFEVGNSIFN